MADEKSIISTTFKENVSVLATPEGFQKYILGTKGNGQPRAVYDVVKDYTQPKKKKKKKGKKKHHNDDSICSLYVSSKKKKKKKKHKKHWHI